MRHITLFPLLKDIIFYFTTLFISCRYCKCLKIKDTKLFRLTLKIEEDNHVQCNKGLLQKSKIRIQGKNNRVINEGEISGTEILMVGMNNQIRIHKGTKFITANIVLRGNGCILEIGSHSTFGSGLYMVCMGNGNSIKIGSDCMFADNVELWNTDSHPVKDMHSGITVNKSKPVNIGNKVWVGKNTVILKGVNIGNGVVTGINSLVTKSLPDNTVCVGNPAKPVRYNVYWERTHTTE